MIQIVRHMTVLVTCACVGIALNALAVPPICGSYYHAWEGLGTSCNNTIVIKYIASFKKKKLDVKHDEGLQTKGR